MGNDGVTVTVVLSPNTSTETLQKSGNTGDEFDLISQVSVNPNKQIKQSDVYCMYMCTCTCICTVKF